MYHTASYTRQLSITPRERDGASTPTATSIRSARSARSSEMTRTPTASAAGAAIQRQRVARACHPGLGDSGSPTRRRTLTCATSVVVTTTLVHFPCESRVVGGRARSILVDGAKSPRHRCSIQAVHSARDGALL